MTCFVLWTAHTSMIASVNCLRKWDEPGERGFGRRGGARVRCKRRGARLPLPLMVCCNIRSLRNKLDEFSALCKCNCAFREASIICLTETWLQEDKDPESAFQIEGHQLVRGDRTEAARKRSGGGVCVYINERWCRTLVSQCLIDSAVTTYNTSRFHYDRSIYQENSTKFS